MAALFPNPWTQRVLLSARNPAIAPAVKKMLLLLQDHPSLLERVISTVGIRDDVPAQATAKPFVLTFPHTANGQSGNLTIESSVILINNGGANASGTVRLRRSDGSPMQVATNLGQGSQFDFVLFPREVLSLETDGTGPLTTGWIEVLSDVQLSGSGTFTTFAGSRVFQSAVGVGDSPRDTRFLVFVDTTDGKSTAVAVCNPGNSLANITYRLRNFDGTQVVDSVDSLAPLTQKARFVKETFGNQFDDFRGVMVVESDLPISVVTLRTRGLNFTSLPAVPIDEPDEDEDEYQLFFARIGDGTFGSLGFDTSLILLNNSVEDVPATIKYFRDNGTDLTLTIDGTEAGEFDVVVPAGGAVELKSDGSTQPGAVGWARVTSEKPLGGGATFTITERTDDSFISEIGVPDSTLTTAPALSVREDTDTSTALALTNTGTNPLTLKLQLLGDRASLQSTAETTAPLVPTVMAETSRPLPSLSHIGLFIPELFPDVAAVSDRDFKGRLLVEASSEQLGDDVLVPVAGITLLSRGTQLTSLPVAELVINFGPTLVPRVATNLLGTSPSLCLEFRQFGGEHLPQSTVLRTDRGRFDFAAMEDSTEVGDMISEVLSFIFIGRIFVTEIEGNRARIHGYLTLDGEHETQPFWGSIQNLNQGGVEMVMESNIVSLDPVLFTSRFTLCFDGGIFQLPDENASPIRFTLDSVSKEATAGQNDTFQSTTTVLLPLEEGVPGEPVINSTSDYRVIGGQDLTIAGAGFGSTPSANTVTVEGNSRVEAEVLSASPTSLNVHLPVTLRSGELRVEAGGRNSNPYFLDAVFAPAVDLTLDTTSAGAASGFQLEITQNPGELALDQVSLFPDTGTWITDGHSQGTSIGSLIVGSPLGSTTLDLRVESSATNQLLINGFESGDDEPSYQVAISDQTLQLQPTELGTSFELIKMTSFELSIEAAVFQLPSQSGTAVNFTIDLTSMPERTLSRDTAFKVAEELSITTD